MDRFRPNAGKRCLWHDYYSRCIYHIVLNKLPGFEDFSRIIGAVGSHDYPPGVSRYRAGEIIQDALSSVKEQFPFVRIQRRCIMPDHVHFSIFIKESGRIHLGKVIIHIKRYCSQEWEKLGYGPSVRFFIDNYYDNILRNKGQFQRMLSYISDNPRRWLIRKQFQNYFQRFRLTDNSGNIYEAYGNWDLLKEPEIAAVKVSRKYSVEELYAKKKGWMEVVMNDGVWISPFIHPMEKKAREWAVKNGGAIINLRAEFFREKYKPGGENFELCAQGRLLEIYLPPQGEKSVEYLKINGKPDYATCARMNALAASLAEGRIALQVLF